METWVALILVCVVITRAHGSDWEVFGKKLPRLLSKAAMAALSFVASYHTFGDILMGVVFGLIAAWAFSMGHNNVFEMKGAEDPADIDACEIISRPLFDRFGWSIARPSYSWVAMGTKGVLIGCATIPTSLGLMLLWPLAYWLCFRLFKCANTPPAEIISGVFVGLSFGWVLL